MTPTSIAVLSLSMSADAFAAAVGRGAAHRPSLFGAMRTGLVFGAIEAVTPLLGWSLGLAASGFVAAVDHWIAFGLLGLVGLRMAFDGSRRLSAAPSDRQPAVRRGLLPLLATAVGTSIDAAAVGVSLALLQADILAIAAAIGLATFAMASLGMMVGRAVGARLGNVAEIAGGLGLVALGSAILLDHTGMLG
ncbi:putative manganese efflux pump MntP [Thalassobaculum fulvum]|uniref:Putative manganese efflux pump MntP n=1 Tax=Thalassobaculum fulvum TaxID=1633335 RepID=A0A918XPT0_9PROT|nr:manganese efflux pump MntP family protein [Thalassobaculum fulvum]GHD42644.1 putative manganese efflux pump MntP [Thalassobaculum fulvum]